MSRRFLLFQLYGPLASWGDIAVGEVRPSFDRPSKSATIGLLAAALGLKRDQDDDHLRLASSFQFAVRLDTPGIYLHDYHTVQIPKGTDARNLATRTDEVNFTKDGKSKLGTVLTYRDYYCDMLATVCLWHHLKVDSPYCSLSKLAAKLKEPIFTLYLGRKSCPPALPLDPVIVEADSVNHAFQHEDARFAEKWKVLGLKSDSVVRYFWEGKEDEGFEQGPDMAVERWDAPGSRSRWQFQPRQEYTKTDRSHVSE